MLYIVGTMDTGGVEVRLLDVLRRLKRDHVQVDICALSGLSGSLDDEARRLGSTVHKLPIRTIHFPRRFKRLLVEHDYRIVHSNVHYTSGMLLKLAAGAGVPRRIANFHSTIDGQGDTFLRNVQRRVMRRLIDRHATAIVGCCETVLEDAWGPHWRNDARCSALYYGHDVDEYARPIPRETARAALGVPADAQLFLHLGRLVPQKNHMRLLAIFAELRRRLPSAWLVLAGPGTDDPNSDVAARIRELGLADRTIRLGARRDVPTLFAAADALLLPSLFEGLPNVVLEACAAGVPVLASDLGGIREIATRLDLIRLLPLTAPDSEWAEVAARLPGEALRSNLKHSAADRFRSSVFHVDHFAEAHRTLWCGSLTGEVACS